MTHVAADRMEAARLLLDELLTNAPVGVALVDTDLRYIHVNEQLAALDGVSAEDHVGRTPAEVVPHFAHELEDVLRDVLADGEAVLNVERAGPRAGSAEPERFWLSSYFPVGGPEDEPAGVAIVAVDITERRRAEEALRASESRVRRLVESNPIAVFLADAERVVEANAAFLRLLGYTEDDLAAGRIRWRDMTPPEWTAADERAIAELAERGACTPFEKEYIARDGRRVPILLGAAVVDRAGPPWVCFILDLSERRLVDERLAFLAEASELVAGSLSPRRTLRRLARLAVPRLADWAIVDVRGPNGALEPVAVVHADGRRLRAAWDLRRRYPARRDDPHGAGAVVRTGRAELYPEIDDAVLVALANDRTHLSRLRGAGHASAVVAPLVARGRTLGALTLISSNPERRYGPEDLGLAEELARRAALAYDNGRLLRAERTARADAERAAQRVAQLGRLADVALAHLGLDDLLDELLERVAEILAVDAAAILLLDDSGRELAPRAARGIDLDAVRDVRVPIGVGFSGRIAADRRPAALADARDGVLQEALGADGPASVAGVPLIVEGRATGVLLVGTVKPHSFPEEDIGLLQLAADRVALAVDRARLLDRHRSVAETLQRSLLPRSLPAVPGVEIAARYRPASAGVEIGGDWYDVIPSRGGLLAVIGDVIGHDLTAASAMGELRHALRAYALVEDDPAALVTQLATLAHELGDDRIATLSVLHLELPGGRLRYVNAGHPPSLLLRRDGSTSFLDGSRCPPVGAFGATFAGADAVLAAGDVVVLYTDGLVEERARPIDEGLERLARAARTGPRDLDALTRHLLAEVVGDGRTLDDIALLAFGLTGR